MQSKVRTVAAIEVEKKEIADLNEWLIENLKSQLEDSREWNEPIANQQEIEVMIDDVCARNKNMMKTLDEELTAARTLESVLAKLPGKNTDNL